MKTQAIIALKLFIVMTVLTGLFYPFCVTGIAQTLFPIQANGSLLKEGKRTVGSELIGQSFVEDGYFWSRPSAVNYQTLPSGASNQSITSAKLKSNVDERKIRFQKQNFLAESTEIPSEMLFASASGLDPHISIEAAKLQVHRIEVFRGLNATQTEQLYQLIDEIKESRQFGLLGEPRVNVLVLNMKLDKLKPL